MGTVRKIQVVGRN